MKITNNISKIRLTGFFKQKIPDHMKVAAVSGACRIIQSGISVLNIRILMSYLGTDVYAGFAIITSAGSWFLLLEFGLGSTLQNFISEARAKNEDAHRMMASLIPVLMAILSISTILLLFISDSIQGFLFKNQPALLSSVPAYLMTVIGLIYTVTALCGISYRVYYAQNRGILANILPAAGSIVSFAALLIIDNYNIQRGSLALASVAVTLPMALVACMGFYNVFIRNKQISLLKIDLKLMKPLFTRAYKFAGMNFMTMLILHIDYIVMSQILKPYDITVYNIITKTFTLVFFMHQAVLAALWPQTTELLTAKEITRVRRKINNHIILGILIVIAGTGTFYITRDIAAQLLSAGKITTLPVSTILLFGLFFIIRAWSDTFGMILQSMSRLKAFWIYMPLQAVICFTGQYILGQMYGINGIAMGLIISYLLTAVWINPVAHLRNLRRYDNQS